MIFLLKKSKKKCLKCRAKWCAHEEKQSDVNFALHCKVTTNKIKQKHLTASLLPEKIYDDAGQIICTRPVEYTLKNI